MIKFPNWRKVLPCMGVVHRWMVILYAAFLMIFGAPAISAPLDLSTRLVELHTEDPKLNVVGNLEYRGGIELRSKNPHFGGLSGMSVTKDGTRLFIVTDKGRWVTLHPIYNRRGWLIGARNAQIGKLLLPNGEPIRDNGRGDGEAIARYRGGLMVSFESDKKLFLYPSGKNPLASRPRELSTPAALQGAPSNGEIETLTILKNGRIFTLTERFSHGATSVIGWITQNRAWHQFIYQRSGKFVPTGAATLPNGDVLLLERRFTWFAGVASRIFRISASDIFPRAVIRGTEIAVLDPPFIVENFEAIDVRTTTNGETLVYILSDDNFLPIQRTLLLQFRLKNSAPGSRS